MGQGFLLGIGRLGLGLNRMEYRVRPPAPAPLLPPGWSSGHLSPLPKLLTSSCPASSFARIRLFSAQQPGELLNPKSDRIPSLLRILQGIHSEHKAVSFTCALSPLHPSAPATGGLLVPRSHQAGSRLRAFTAAVLSF